MSVKHMRGIRVKRTSHTGKELTSKTLNLRTRKGHKAVAFEKIKDALAQKIGDDADVVPKVKGVS